MSEHDTAESGMNRKHFIRLTAAAAAVAGCESLKPGGGPATAGNGRTIDAGPSAGYAGSGPYANFRDQGFFLLRKDGKLMALSSYCTHRHCKLEAEPDRSFYCPCHGSTFDPTGTVTEGPARRGLPQFPMSIDARGHVLVTVV